jgi:hypothetical protein
MYSVLCGIALFAMFLLTAMHHLLISMASPLDVIYFCILWFALFFAVRLPSYVAYPISATIGVLFVAPIFMLPSIEQILSLLQSTPASTLGFVVAACISQYSMRWLFGVDRGNRLNSSPQQ